MKEANVPFISSRLDLGVNCNCECADQHGRMKSTNMLRRSVECPRLFDSNTHDSMPRPKFITMLASARHNGLRFIIVGIALFLLFQSYDPPLANAKSIVVSVTADVSDGDCFDATCSLRDAIDAAVDGDVIVLLPGTYSLTQGALDLQHKSLTFQSLNGEVIIAEASADMWQSTIVWEGIDFRFFRFNVLVESQMTFSDVLMDGGKMTINESDVVIDNPTLINGVNQNGGIILHEVGGGSLTIRDSLLANNSSGFGGAIFFLGKDLTIERSILTTRRALEGRYTPARS